MGKGESGEEGGLICVWSSVDGEAGSFFPRDPSNSLRLRLATPINVSQADLPVNPAMQTPQLRPTFYPENSLPLLQQSLQIVCRFSFLNR